MKFVSLKFNNFRNIQNTTLSVNAHTIYLVGNNAQGKSNILEGIYVLAYGTSFRTRQLEHLSHHDHKAFYLEGEIIDNYNVSHTVVFRWEEGRREIFIDDRKITDRRELFAFIPCIVFSHEDYRYISGGPEYRRRFFDQIQCLYDTLYIEVIRKYTRILKLRNQALRERRINLLDVYDYQLAEEGLKIIKARQSTAERILKRLLELYDTPMFQNMLFSVRYVSSWSTAHTLESVQKRLFASREGDIDASNTRSGPHRDNIYFTFNNYNVATVGSTGQIRLLSLLLKVLQGETIVQMTQKHPVLLIDDVLLELDKETRKYLRGVIPTSSQEFYTFLHDKETGVFGNHQSTTYYISNGNVSRDPAR